MRRLRPATDARSFAISVVVHVLVLGALGRMVLGPVRWAELFDVQRETVTSERLRFVQLPRGAAGTQDRTGRSGGDNRPVQPDQPPPPPLVAPTVVPDELPPSAVAVMPPRAPSGSGPLIGGGGPVRGLQPTFTDPRLWARAGEPMRPLDAGPPLPTSERLDSTIVAMVERWRDSVLAANAGRAPRGWIYEKDGKKYGIDEQFIRLGKWSIPTAVLALLPLNVQGNPTTGQRNAQLASMRYEMDWQAQRAVAEDEFRAAVRALRARKERERREKQQATTPEVVAPDAVAPPIVPRTVVPAAPPDRR